MADGVEGAQHREGLWLLGVVVMLAFISSFHASSLDCKSENNPWALNKSVDF